MISPRCRSIVGSTLLVGSVLALTGCFSYLSEKRTGSPSTQTVPFPDRAIGTARMTLLPHDDGLGWTVSAERKVIRESLVETSQGWTGRRYLFSPLSIFAGMIQCPIGLFTVLHQNPNNKDLQFGCARLIMMEPLDGQVTLPPTRSLEVNRTDAWEPLRNGIVQLDWPGNFRGTVTYALGQTGRVDVRLAHLLAHTHSNVQSPTTASSAQLRIRLRYDDGTFVDRRVSATSAQLMQARGHLPSSIAGGKWPLALVMTVQVDSSTISEDEREVMRDRLTNWIIREGFCAVVEEHFHGIFIDEQRIQHTDSPDRDQPVKLGRLLSPNIALHSTLLARQEGGEQIKEVILRLVNQQEGKIIAVTRALTRTNMLRNPLDRALADLALITAHAPRGRCPASQAEMPE
jgi:hypothetical protein